MWRYNKCYVMLHNPKPHFYSEICHADLDIRSHLFH